MPDPPQKATPEKEAWLTRRKKNVLAVGPRIPVILVPGILASRLTSRRRGVVWDPNDLGYMIADHLLAEPEKQRILFSQEDTEVIHYEIGLDSDQNAQGWGEVVRDVYLRFLWQCQHRTFRCFRPAVYVVGYDFTRSNYEAAERLFGGIRNVLNREKARAFLLVTHSMGSLLARATLKRNPQLEPNCLGVIHVVPPNQGAVIFYTRFHTGASDESWAVSKIMGDEAWKFSTVVSAVISAFELLPTNDYAAPGEKPREWLKLSRDGTPEKACPPNDLFPIYADRQHFASVCQHAPAGVVRASIVQYVQSAQAFHKWLGDYMHPRTAIITASNSSTNVGISVDTVKGVKPQYALQGDGTVPLASAQAFKAIGRKDFPGVNHAGALKNDAVMAQVFDWLDRLVYAAYLRQRKKQAGG